MNQNLSVKVSDHAIYCNKYDHVYYVDGCYRKIPLRWMAWEAVILVRLFSFFFFLHVDVKNIKFLNVR